MYKVAEDLNSVRQVERAGGVIVEVVFVKGLNTLSASSYKSMSYSCLINSEMQS